jgi:hypothetical protein
MQRQLLKDEGVVFDKSDRVDLDKFQWSGQQKLRMRKQTRRGMIRQK